MEYAIEGLPQVCGNLKQARTKCMEIPWKKRRMSNDLCHMRQDTLDLCMPVKLLMAFERPGLSLLLFHIYGTSE